MEREKSFWDKKYLFGLTNRRLAWTAVILGAIGYIGLPLVKASAAPALQVA